MGYLRVFEDAIVQTLKEFGIEVQGRSLQKKSDSEADETGVWVGSRKFASLGVAVKKWATYHGAAINFSKAPTALQGIDPCRFKSDVVLTVKEADSSSLQRQEFQDRLKQNLLNSL